MIEKIFIKISKKVNRFEQGKGTHMPLTTAHVIEKAVPAIFLQALQQHLPPYLESLALHKIIWDLKEEIPAELRCPSNHPPIRTVWKTSKA